MFSKLRLTPQLSRGLVLLPVTLLGCGENAGNEPSVSSGGASGHTSVSYGGASTGGASFGGAATQTSGGATLASGGNVASGGALGLGGSSNGGNTNGGSAPSAGGTAGSAGASGSSAGGAVSSGGASSGGVAGGGTSSGGAASGGKATSGGSSSSGGASSGGASSGGGTSVAGGTGTCAGNTTANLGLVGYATMTSGTTGGKGGTRVTVSTGTELVAALKAKQDSTAPLTIVVTGTITPANSGGAEKFDVKDIRDVSIIGAGAGAEFNGIGIKIVKAGNIVLRNLKIHNVLIGDKDAISIEGPADHIWVDHCELYSQYQGVDKDYYDGLLDAKADTEYLTYSWNYFHDSWKTSLVGSSESDTFDRKITMHHNYYKNCNSRLPLFRGGSAHIFNNYYQDIAETAINSRSGACVQIENNYFSKVTNPWVSAFTSALGGGEFICNTLADGSAFAYSDSNEIYQLPACTLTVPYDYSAFLNLPAEVPRIVTANAGVGKLANPETF